jgi:hypothetical protein
MAVDILPTSIPYDASVHFSQALMPYLRVLVRQHRGERLDTEAEKETASGLQNAVIAEKGVLVSRLCHSIWGLSDQYADSASRMAAKLGRDLERLR